MNKLKNPIRKTVKTAFNITKGEEVVIVTDEDKLDIARVFADELDNLGAKVNVDLLLEENRPYTELTDTFKASISNLDLLIYMMRDIVEEKPFRVQMVAKGRKNARVCMMPGVTRDIVERTFDIDYHELEDFTEKVRNFLKNSKEVTVTNKKGTDISFSVEGREFEADTGKVTRKGGYGNLPAGETFTAPVEETFTGAIHFKFISDFESDRGFFKFEEGEVVEHGGISPKLEEIMEKKENRTIGEFGVGTNPKARAVSDFLEAEKARNTVHFAIGDSYGKGKNESEYHFDFLLEEPTVTADGKVLMKEGEFQFS